MRHSSSVLDLSRVQLDGMPPTHQGEMHGAFMLKYYRVVLKIISSGHAVPKSADPHAHWEHVSVSLFEAKRIPTWEEMKFVKGVFWRPDETVIQFHPRESQYVNENEFVLHLWKPPYELRLPPRSAV